MRGVPLYLFLMNSCVGPQHRTPKAALGSPAPPHLRWPPGRSGRMMADPDFLADCHERVRAVYRYWEGTRNGRLMPSRADLDPLEIPRYLPDICLVDVVADARKYVYRLIGTNEAAMRGRDPTGLPVGQGYFGTSAASVFLN